MMKNGGNANDAAYTAYLNGIKANLSKIGVSSSADAFINDSHISVGSSNLTINQLINESMRLCFKSWKHGWIKEDTNILPSVATKS